MQHYLSPIFSPVKSLSVFLMCISCLKKVVIFWNIINVQILNRKSVVVLTINYIKISIFFKNTPSQSKTIFC